MPKCHWQLLGRMLYFVADECNVLHSLRRRQCTHGKASAEHAPALEKSGALVVAGSAQPPSAHSAAVSVRHAVRGPCDFASLLCDIRHAYNIAALLLSNATDRMSLTKGSAVLIIAFRAFTRSLAPR